MMSDMDPEIYKLQLEAVEDVLTTDPKNEELLQLKNNMKQVLIPTQDLINLQNEAAPNEEEAAFETNKLKQNIKQWSEDLINSVKLWQVGEDCQAIYPVDGAYHDATIEDISTNGKVIVKFNGYSSVFVTTLGLLKLPVNGITTVHNTTFSAEDMRKITAYRNYYLKENKVKRATELKEMEREGKRKQKKWSKCECKRCEWCMEKHLTRKDL